MTQLDTQVLWGQAVLVTQSRTNRILGEDALSPESQAVLQQLGVALDEQRPLRVHGDGVVKEHFNEQQGAGGPAARPRQRPARRQGPSGRSRSPGAPTRIGVGLHHDYESQLALLSGAYPSLTVHPDADGMWLLARSKIIPGLAREATFLVALPHSGGLGPRSWGFWTAGGRQRWIGPRHTNFQDGSICAFSPGDGAWQDGGDLRTLFDLYSVWALRHLHLEVFDRWPGKQYGMTGADPLVQAYYRQRECKDDELCGCGSESRRYAECCKPFDVKGDFIQLASHFMRQVPGGFGTRHPPTAIVEFVEGRAALPEMVSVHIPMIAQANSR